MMIDARRTCSITTSMSVAFSSVGDFLCARILNLSSSGAFIETDTVLPMSTDLAMRIRLPDDMETMEIVGRVVWAKHASACSPAGMGVEFINLTHAYQQKISAFVEEHLCRWCLAESSAVEAL